MAKGQVLKWSGEDIVKFLNMYKNFDALWDTLMKTMKKNAREHNINRVMQELTAAALHIDNEESFNKLKT